MPRLTIAQSLARYQNFVEAAEHLTTTFTDDPVEQAEAEYCRKQIEKLADKWFDRAQELPE